MKTIPLSRGMVAIVDDDDYERISKYKWTAIPKDNKYYAMRSEYINNKKKVIYIHRFIMNAGKGSLIDHKNGNPLDNRKENLRFCTYSQNTRNSKKRVNCSSRFIGVHLTHDKKWVAQIRLNGKNTHLGTFEVEEEAAKKYNEVASKYFGEFASLNNI